MLLKLYDPPKNVNNPEQLFNDKSEGGIRVVELNNAFRRDGKILIFQL